MVDQWFLPFNIPSLKNSKVKTSRGIFHSKTVGKFLKEIGIVKYSPSKKLVVEYKTKPNLFRECLKDFPVLKQEDYPIKLGFHFIRNSKRSFDFNNANQILLDLLTAHNFIEDDSMEYLLPFPLEIDGKYYKVDKENCGVWIKILK